MATTCRAVAGSRIGNPSRVRNHGMAGEIRAMASHTGTTTVEGSSATRCTAVRIRTTVGQGDIGRHAIDSAPQSAGIVGIDLMAGSTLSLIEMDLVGVGCTSQDER